MTKVLHVKIPVTDLEKSAQFYASLMDLVLTREFIERGELRGAALYSPEARCSFALRERAYCASEPVLAGFDVVSLHMASRDALVELQQRCAALGVEYTDIQDRSANEAVVDVTDPDGTILRFYWVGETDQPDTFLGVVFGEDGPPQLVREPRLTSVPALT